MTVTVAQFRADFPQFTSAAYPDATVQFWLDLAPAYVGDTWAQFQDKGAELFTAHNLAVGPTTGAGGVVTGGSVSGPITSKSIKDVSVSYDASVGLDDTAGFYNATISGRQFWQLRKLFGKGVLQLTGADLTGFYGQPGTSIYPLGGLS